MRTVSVQTFNGNRERWVRAINHRSSKYALADGEGQQERNSSDIHMRKPLIAFRGEGQNPRRLDMSEKMISRRGAFTLLGLAAALALPTSLLTTSEAEAQAQPGAPAPGAPAPAAPALGAPAPGAPATSGMTRRQARRAGRKQRREARHNARQMRREARHNARMQRREARRGNSLYMKSNQPTKQQ
jgi:hypothetical protein